MIQKLLLTFLLLLRIVPAGAAAPRQLKLSDIPILYNIDSLEAVAQTMDKSQEPYLRCLMTIEWSRLQVRSGQYGLHCAAISRLSHLLGQDIGVPFVSYITASSNLRPGYAVNHFTLNAAEEALRQFSANHDTYGMYFCNTLIARLYTFRVSQQTFNNPDSAATEIKEGKEKIKAHNAAADSLCRSVNDSSLWVYNTLHQAKTKVSGQANAGDIAAAKEMCRAVLAYLAGQAVPSHYTSLTYFFYANAFTVQDSLTKGIALEKSGVEALLPAQIALRFGALVSIANHTNTLGQIDTSMRYCRMALDYLSVYPARGEYDLLTLYENVVSNFQEKQQLDSALYYSEQLKMASSLYFQSLYENEQKNFAFDMQFALDKQKIEAQSRLNKRISIVTLLFLSVLMIALILIFRSRRKLKHAYLQIQNLQHAREKFYSIVAHDLKSPLISYQNLAATLNRLIKRNDFAQIEKISQRIDDNGARLQVMLENLFQWSLSEQKSLSYRARPVHPEDVLRNILALYTEMADEKRLSFIQEVSCQQPLVTDPNYLQTVVRNLLDNAIKNAQSFVHLRISAKGSNMELLVINDGTISAEKSATITELFRSDKLWQPGERGIGLGLVLTREFCQKMNASIDFSANDKQICFRITFPS